MAGKHDLCLSVNPPPPTYTRAHARTHTHSLKTHRHKWQSLNIRQIHSIQPILHIKPESRVGGRAETYLQSKSRIRDIQIKSLRCRMYTWTWLLFNTYGVQLCKWAGEGALLQCSEWTTSSTLQGCICELVCSYTPHQSWRNSKYIKNINKLSCVAWAS